MPKVQRSCEVCGATFAVNPSVVAKGRGRFCSRLCYAKWSSENRLGENHPHWKGGGKECICQVCGKTFQIGRAVAKKENSGKYCSWSCQYVGAAQARKVKYDRIGRATTKCVCEVCSKEFERANSAIKNGEGRFCSRKCHGVYRSAHMIGEKAANWKGKTTVGMCERCGKEIRVQQARRDGGNRDRFCSRACYHDWYGETHQGANSWLWRGGREPYPEGWSSYIRRKVRERFDNKCAVCGKAEQENGRRLAVHHIDYDKKNLDLDNLIALCTSCHAKTSVHREYWQPLLEAEVSRHREGS